MKLTTSLESLLTFGNARTCASISIKVGQIAMVVKHHSTLASELLKNCAATVARQITTSSQKLLDHCT